MSNTVGFKTDEIPGFDLSPLLLVISILILVLSIVGFFNYKKRNGYRDKSVSQLSAVEVQVLDKRYLQGGLKLSVISVDKCKFVVFEKNGCLEVKALLDSENADNHLSLLKSGSS